MARLRSIVIDDDAPVEPLARRLVGLGATAGVVSPPPAGW
jgi:hypothetical protein